MGAGPVFPTIRTSGTVDFDAKILSIGKNYTIKPKSLTAMEI